MGKYYIDLEPCRPRELIVYNTMNTRFFGNRKFRYKMLDLKQIIWDIETYG